MIINEMVMMISTFNNAWEARQQNNLNKHIMII